MLIGKWWLVADCSVDQGASLTNNNMNCFPWRPKPWKHGAGPDQNIGRRPQGLQVARGRRNIWLVSSETLPWMGFLAEWVEVDPAQPAENLSNHLKLWNHASIGLWLQLRLQKLMGLIWPLLQRWLLCSPVRFIAWSTCCAQISISLAIEIKFILTCQRRWFDEIKLFFVHCLLHQVQQLRRKGKGKGYHGPGGGKKSGLHYDTMKGVPWF